MIEVLSMTSRFSKLFAILLGLILQSCGPSGSQQNEDEIDWSYETPNTSVEMRYGINMCDYDLVLDTIRSGDTFGELMKKHKADYQKVLEATRSFRTVFDLRRIRRGRPYRILKSKDSLNKAQVFIYENDKLNYTLVDFRDSVEVSTKQRPFYLVENEYAGEIESSLYMTLDDLGIDQNLSLSLSDIYAWNIDFFRLFEGDKFKAIVRERYLEDGSYIGIDGITAAYFEHKGDPYYAFAAKVDTVSGQIDYFDEKGNNLRRTFLKAPLKFASYRISSRYNLKRRIAYYGNRIRPHKGTDYAAPIGTPIIATADGVVTEARRKGGNGIYAKIKHNSTYSTQYLHMRRLNVKRGQKVRQGQVIGWIGMTGNTSGPHVCYRFWKNGSQVDPLRQKLPAAAPIDKSYANAFFNYVQSPLDQLNCIDYDFEPLSFDASRLSYITPETTNDTQQNQS